MVHSTPLLVGTVAALHRYPVKSMLGEALAAAIVTGNGIKGDRAHALIDAATGNVASAKRPQLWRSLLGCTARTDAATGAVSVQLPGGSAHVAGSAVLDMILSSLTTRGVWLSQVPPEAAAVERSHPEAVLAEGLDAPVGMDSLTLGQGAPAGTFMDFAPLHLITSATLAALCATQADGPLETLRYRPNIVIETAPDVRGFPENDWLEGTLHIGDAVAVKIILASPRCAIPTLAHGALPPRPDALRAAIALNKVDIPGFGVQPCAGVYASVLMAGSIRVGDKVTFTAA